ncbi:MAG: DNA topoisomerase IV [Flavobacteriaceae bacterium]
MKKLGVLLIVFFFAGCYQVERNCLPFHEGRFQFTTMVNGEMQQSVFVRTGDLEIESYQGVIDSARIRWVNACECILTKLNPSNNQDKRPIRMKILKTKDSTEYTFEYALVGDTKNTQRGTIEKIK